MGRSIFISYRRDDTEGEAGRLYDDLVQAFGDNSVFMDVSAISPGVDFRTAIDDNVAGCGVLLATIGPQWTTIANNSGQRRLDDPNDFVRLEIASALERNIAVIPVLVHSAKMPHPDELPDNLKDLAYRNSVEITHARWNSDVQLLTKALSQYVTSASSTNTEPVHATVPVQLPPPGAQTPKMAPAGSSKTPLFAGLGVIVILAIAVGAFFILHSSGGNGAGAAETAAASQTAQPVASAAPTTGAWVNSSLKIRENMPRRLEISGTADQLTFHMWGACDDCDWGAQPATKQQGDWIAQWTFSKPLADDPPGRVTELRVTPAGSELHLIVRSRLPGNHYIQGKWSFVRAAQ